MKTYTSFPDLARSAKLLSISVELEGVDPETTFGLAIKLALKKKDLKRCIEMILSQANDNRPLVSHLIGEDLLKKIESLNH